jgi:hypothetical protein
MSKEERKKEREKDRESLKAQLPHCSNPQGFLPDAEEVKLSLQKSPPGVRGRKEAECGRREEEEERPLGLHLKAPASPLTAIHKKRFKKERHLRESNNILEKIKDRGK